MQEREWRLMTLALLRVLSIERLPALQEHFDGRVGALRVSSMLSDAGCSPEEFDALLEVLLPSKP